MNPPKILFKFLLSCVLSIQCFHVSSQLIEIADLCDGSVNCYTNYGVIFNENLHFVDQGTMYYTSGIFEKLDTFQDFPFDIVNLLGGESVIYFSAREEFSAISKYRIYKTDGSIANTLPISTEIDDLFYIGSDVNLNLAEDKIMYTNHWPLPDNWSYACCGNINFLDTKIFETFVLDSIGQRLISYATPSEYTKFNDKYYFNVRFNGSQNLDVAYSDLTKVGTQLISDDSDLLSSRIMTSFKDRLWLSSLDTIHGHEIWSTNGMKGETELLKDIYNGIGSSFPAFIHQTDSLMYFSAIDEEFGRNLWVTDGTSAGTEMLFKVDSELETIFYFSYLLGDKILLLLTTQDIYVGAYVFDGYNTELIEDLTNAKVDNPLGIFDEVVYYSYDDGIHGREIWFYDYSNNKAGLFADLNPGPDGSYASRFIFNSDGFYFSNKTEDGKKLYYYKNLTTDITETELIPDLPFCIPNPTDGHISIDNSIDVDQISILDTKGMKMLNVDVIVKSIDLSVLVSGVYFLQYIDKDGRIISTEKVIKL